LIEKETAVRFQVQALQREAIPLRGGFVKVLLVMQDKGLKVRAVVARRYHAEVQVMKGLERDLPQ
jgi:hypothetical protein